MRPHVKIRRTILFNFRLGVIEFFVDLHHNGSLTNFNIANRNKYYLCNR